MTKATKAEQEQAKEQLHRILKPGSTVYTILRHVSRSGMSRVISLLVESDGRIINIDWAASKLLEGYNDRHGGCKASGCGMDMGFALVYNLGRRLWPDGFETWPGYWRNEPKDFDNDGGYALKQQWL